MLAAWLAGISFLAKQARDPSSLVTFIKHAQDEDTSAVDEGDGVALRFLTHQEPERSSSCRIEGVG